MPLTLAAPENVVAEPRDNAVCVKWDPVEGADGYMLFFFREEKPRVCIKRRYSQKNTKQVLGFFNGEKYLVAVRAFYYEDGKECEGEASAKIPFTPMLKKVIDLIDFEKARTVSPYSVRDLLKRIFPDLNIICDPSHIAGRRELVESLAQTAMNLGLDGLMIEVHNNPKEAKTDSKQQLSIEEFKSLLNSLIISKTEENILPEKINILRKEIDEIDNKLIELLSERMKVSNKIAQIKKESNISVLQMNRWNKLLFDRMEYAKNIGVSESFIKEIFELIHKESVKLQDEIIKIN